MIMVSEYTPNKVMSPQPADDRLQPLLAAMLDSSPDAILVLDQQQRVVFINQALMNFLTIPVRELVYGLNPGAIFQCVDADQPEPQCSETEPCKMCGVLRIIDSNVIGQNIIQDVRVLQPDLTPLELRVSGRPLLIENQLYTMFTLRDIGVERHRLLLDRLFFHDIMNTAGLVKGYADILRDATDDELTLIQEQLSRTSARLINEIETQRVLTAAENDDLYVDWALASAGALLEDLQAEYLHHEVARERSIEIVSLDPSILTTDSTLLGRVLGNLIKNALEASSPGQVVSLSCWQADTAIVFAVHNPTVIPPHIQPHIFKRAISTKGQGRGIGTYSAKLLTERYLNGQIAFTTSEAEGTTFSVSYPL